MKGRQSMVFIACAFMSGLAGHAQVPVGPEFRANELGKNPQIDQVLAVARNGNFLTVWEGRTEDTTQNVLWGQWFSPNGQPVGHNLVLQRSPLQAYQAAVGAGPTGGMSVFWRRTHYSTITEWWDDLIGGEFSADGSWLVSPHRLMWLQQLAPRFVRSRPQGGQVVASIGSRPRRSGTRTFLLRTDESGNVVRGPGMVYPTRHGSQDVDGLGMSPSGQFLVAWTEEASHTAKVLTQLFSADGRPLHAPVQVHGETPNLEFVGRVAALGDKGFVVVWDDGNAVTGGVDLKMRFLNPDGSVRGPVQRVDPEPGYRLLGGDIAADAAGNFFVVWEAAGPRGLDSGVDVWGRMFRVDGTPFGPSRVLNTFKPNTQKEPIVAANAGGTFAVIWQSSEQDGDEEGIFGQVFAVPRAGEGDGFPPS